GNGRTEDGGYFAEGAGGDGGPAAPRERAGTARTEKTGRSAAQRSTPRPSTDEVSKGGLRGTDDPGVSPFRPRTQQSKDGGQMEEVEQPQGRRKQSQGGQRNSGGRTSGDHQALGVGGRSGGRTGVARLTSRNPIAPNHAVLAQLNLLSEEELDAACKAAGWRGKLREADESETGGAGQVLSTHQSQVPPDGAPRGRGEGDRQEVGSGQLGGPPTTPTPTTLPYAARGEGVLPPGGIMGTGQKREAVVAKGVTNRQDSKGLRVEGYRGEAQQDKLAWSAHGADGAADVPLLASADGKWAPGEYVEATVVQGWIRHAASKGYRDGGETRPPSV
ncbi:hypothetical protein B484DRAFT_409161, partial [Ochromonadaceae sp. CCMP2298]